MKTEAEIREMIEALKNIPMRAVAQREDEVAAISGAVVLQWALGEDDSLTNALEGAKSGKSNVRFFQDYLE